jgi:hypothetical protein
MQYLRTTQRDPGLWLVAVQYGLPSRVALKKAMGPGSCRLASDHNSPFPRLCCPAIWAEYCRTVVASTGAIHLPTIAGDFLLQGPAVTSDSGCVAKVQQPCKRRLINLFQLGRIRVLLDSFCDATSNLASLSPTDQPSPCSPVTQPKVRSTAPAGCVHHFSQSGALPKSSALAVWRGVLFLECANAY